jgi:pimeloyl-ACP methyl ester carboxylesterase
MTRTEAHELRTRVWRKSIPSSTIPVRRLKIEKRRLTGSTIIVESIRFPAGKYRGKRKGIFAYYAYPEPGQNQRHPTILMVHGGQCVAWSDAVCALVDRGYAALMLDLPGKGSLREESRSTGPSMGPDIFHPEPSRNFLFHAVDSARHALAVLRNLPQTDRDRIAVMGDSWGSFISSILVAMEKEVAALVLVNGCGFIFGPKIPTGKLGLNAAEKMSPPEIEKWDALYDPRHYYPAIRCPVLLGYTRDERQFSKQQFAASYQLIPSRLKKRLVCDGAHEIDGPARESIYRWLAQRINKPN